MNRIKLAISLFLLALLNPKEMSIVFKGYETYKERSNAKSIT